MFEYIDVQIDGWMYRWMDGCIDGGWMYRQMGGQIDGGWCIDRWMYR